VLILSMGEASVLCGQLICSHEYVQLSNAGVLYLIRVKVALVYILSLIIAYFAAS